jgi:putative hydrolase of the HAD superfamily
MGISRTSVLYVGNDMRNDILPATKTGFQTALFAGDRRSLRLREDDPQCKNVVPNLVITDLIQILEHVK